MAVLHWLITARPNWINAIFQAARIMREYAEIQPGIAQKRKTSRNSRSEWVVTDLGGEDVQVDAGQALEVLLEEALGIVLPDLLPRHGLGSRKARRLMVGRARARCCGLEAE